VDPTEATRQCREAEKSGDPPHALIGGNRETVADNGQPRPVPLSFRLLERPRTTTRRNLLSGVLAVVALAASPVAGAEEMATVMGNEVIRAEANAGASAVGTLAQGSSVHLLERKGFWVRVKSGAGTGWLKLSGLSLQSQKSASSALPISASGRIGSGNVVSATGTRGISGEALVSARPDVAGVHQLQRNAVSSAEADRFASEGQLVSRNLDYVRSAGSAPAARPPQGQGSGG